MNSVYFKYRIVKKTFSYGSIYFIIQRRYTIKGLINQLYYKPTLSRASSLILISIVFILVPLYTILFNYRTDQSFNDKD